jgi:hypothetical protein
MQLSVDLEGALLVAAPDPRHWHELPWRNIHDPNSPTYRLRTDSTYSRGGNPLPRGTVGVLTYRDVLAAYRVHPEPKSLGPDGRPCRRSTIGLLHRRPVQARSITHIGKETNLLDELQAGLIGDEEQVVTEYVDQRLDSFVSLVIPIVCEMPILRAATLADVSPRTIDRIRAGANQTSAATRRLLTDAAAAYARERLERLIPEGKRERDAVEACARYLDVRRPRSCPTCGNPVLGARATYCSRACRDRGRHRRKDPRPPSTDRTATHVIGLAEFERVIDRVEWIAEWIDTTSSAPRYLTLHVGTAGTQLQVRVRDDKASRLRLADAVERAHVPRDYGTNPLTGERG